MSLNIYVGKNKTGKTKAIEELNDDKNDFTLYLPTEMILKDFISKENFGSSANKILSPLAKIINFINDIYSVKTKTRLSVKNKELRKEINELIKEIK